MALREGVVRALFGGTFSSFGLGVRSVGDAWILVAHTVSGTMSGDPIEPADLLDWLCDVFVPFAAPFSNGDVEETQIDFRGWGIPLSLRRVGLRVEVLPAELPAQVEERESVLVVETLLTLGEICLSLGACGSPAERWSSIKASCLLFAAAPDGDEAGWSLGWDLAEITREAGWAAGQLGQALEDYVAAAEWLTSRQRLFAVGKLAGEPAVEEWSVMSIPDLPSREAIARMVEEAAAAFDETLETLRCEALATRNVDARQVLVFERFYGPLRY